MVMFSSNFRIPDENEGVEILETTELSPIPIAQVTVMEQLNVLLSLF